MVDVGYFAAVATAVCWALNTVLFAMAGKRVGSESVNHIRLWIALLCTVLVHFVSYGTFFPTHAGLASVVFLSLSGLVGYVIGDAFLFESFLLIGPHRSMLIMTLAPLFGAFFAWLFLHESLGFKHILGMVVTLAGIFLVVCQRKPQEKAMEPEKKSVRGFLFALAGAAGQGGGLVLSKVGMAQGLPPISANCIRLSMGTLGIFLVTLFRRQLKNHVSHLGNAGAFGLIFVGALLGPVIGVTLSLFSVQRISVGIASTLMQLSPVLIIPAAHFFMKERASATGVVGTCVAVGGAALLFLA